MTLIPSTERSYLKRIDERPPEDDIFYMYGSTAAHITEETEYVRKIRGTLEKIQSQLFTDESNGKTALEGNASHLQQNGCTQEDNSFASRYKRIAEKLKDQDLQFEDVHRENEDLQIKLEATREAGAGALRDATRKLYENYGKQSEQLRKSHEEEKQKLQIAAVQHEDQFKKSVQKLNEVAEKIQEKHGRILELEKLMERMEDEKAALMEKKHLLENELIKQTGDPFNRNGCVAMQTKVSTVQEQIDHLQHLMMSQHQHLRALIQEREDLKEHLKEQDITIGELKEKVNVLESQNKELKYKVDHWSSPSKLKMAKGTSVTESMFGSDNRTPYYMLLKHKNPMGNS
ncbi:PREDICTED: coiled-coil domain-containing protein 68 [Nanorana parkeri]|uniref:coiled-coil domain-containing protein 68 n=1 Tax=Nanorana parkeri TaxID=125878 RepID=UPI000853FA58|nr:PREDICTED: coiled-coil domain-containing protein 68 [Nanorana parkeri]XP_018425774.1 PREDICTED: coiled-coil domain-containing protein 68 [Nanorana parkeri]